MDGASFAIGMAVGIGSGIGIGLTIGEQEIKKRIKQLINLKKVKIIDKKGSEVFSKDLERILKKIY